MAIKIDYVCPVCNKNHIKDYTITGDYDEGGVLLSFCPRCGRMYKITLSQNTRKIIAVRLAMRCNLDFGTTKQVTTDAPKDIFLEYVKETLNILKEDVLAVIENISKK